MSGFPWGRAGVGSAAWALLLLALGLINVTCGDNFARPPAPSSVNGWVAYCVYDSVIPAIWKIRLDGTGARRLGVRGWNCRWDPQGARLSFANRVGFQWHVFISDSSGAHLLDTGVSASDFSAWSPDGRNVLAGGLLRDAETGEQLGPPPTPPQVFDGDSVYPAYPWEFTRDDRHVVVKGFNHHPGGADSCRLRYDYYVTDIHSGAIVERLTKTRYTDCTDSVLAVSPNGRKILMRCGFGALRITLAVLDVETQQLVGVTSGRVDFAGRWGSDNRSIVFIRLREPAGRHETHSLLYTSLDSLGHERMILDQDVELKGFDVHLDAGRPK